MSPTSLLILGLVLHADPTPTPAFPNVGKVDRLTPAPWVEIKADPTLTKLTAPVGSQWFPVDDGCELDPSTDGAIAYFATTAEKGRFRVVVVSGMTVNRIVIVKGDASPKPPGPVDPPNPSDPLVAKLQAAYKLDPRADAKKFDELKSLIELYKQAAEFAVNTEITSVAALAVKVKESWKPLGIEGLDDLRKVLLAELKAVFPDDLPFDPASRAKARSLFLKLSEALKNVK